MRVNGDTSFPVSMCGFSFPLERRYAARNKPVPSLPNRLDESHYQAADAKRILSMEWTVVKFDGKFMITLSSSGAKTFDREIGMR